MARNGEGVLMDESLTDEQRAALKARAIERLRRQEASLERSHQINPYRERGEIMLTPPSALDSYNQDVRDLRRAGEAVPGWYIREPYLIDWRQGKHGKPMKMIDGSGLLSDIKRVLEIVDPQA
jgi:hypothetical protein